MHMNENLYFLFFYKNKIIIKNFLIQFHINQKKKETIYDISYILIIKLLIK